MNMFQAFRGSEASPPTGGEPDPLPPSVGPASGTSLDVSLPTVTRYADKIIAQIEAGAPVPGAVNRICEQLGSETPDGRHALERLAQVRYNLAMKAFSSYTRPQDWVIAAVPPMPEG